MSKELFGFELCEFPPDDDFECEWCHKLNVQLYCKTDYWGEDSQYACLPCLEKEKAALVELELKEGA